MTLGPLPVDWQGIERRLLANGGDWLYLQLVLDEPTLERAAAALVVARDAIAAANLTVEGGTTVATGVAPLPQGPALLLAPGPDDELETWVAAFSRHMVDAGWAGRIVAAPEPRPTDLLHSPAGVPTLSAFLSYRLTGPGPSRQGEWLPPFWGVDPDVTRDVCATLAGWATRMSGGTVVGLGQAHVVASPGEEANLLAWALGQDETANVQTAVDGPVRLRRVALDLRGLVVACQRDAVMDWRARLDAVASAFRARPDALQLGFVRGGSTSAVSWWRLPRLGDGTVLPARQQHLWDRYVPDVHGMQVLTAAHLDRAGGLDGWRVEELAPDRYLVAARDLEPWYAGDQPDPDVLAEARRQLADIILTAQVATENPPEYLRPRP